MLDDGEDAAANVRVSRPAVVVQISFARYVLRADYQPLTGISSLVTLKCIRMLLAAAISASTRQVSDTCTAGSYAGVLHAVSCAGQPPYEAMKLSKLSDRS